MRLSIVLLPAHRDRHDLLARPRKHIAVIWIAEAIGRGDDEADGVLPAMEAHLLAEDMAVGGGARGEGTRRLGEERWVRVVGVVIVREVDEGVGVGVVVGWERLGFEIVPFVGEFIRVGALVFGVGVGVEVIGEVGQLLHGLREGERGDEEGQDRES